MKTKSSKTETQKNFAKNILSLKYTATEQNMMAASGPIEGGALLLAKSATKTNGVPPPPSSSFQNFVYLANLPYFK